MKRVTVPLDDAVFDRMNTTIRHGLRSPLMASLLTMALEAVERDGEMMVGAIMAGQYKLVPAYEKAA